MAVCRITDVKILDNNAKIDQELRFEVTLDLAEPLAEDVVFRCVYVVDPCLEDKGDLELESIDVGNGPGLQRGALQFVFEAKAPDRETLTAAGALKEVTGLYLSASYRSKEFCRIGYFVRLEYEDPARQEEPPETPDWEALRRVLSDPCVTRFQIPWDRPQMPPVAPEGEEAVFDSPPDMSHFPGFPWPVQGRAAQAPSIGGEAGAEVRDRSRSPRREAQAAEGFQDDAVFR